MNRLLSVKEAATYCQNLPLTYFAHPRFDAVDHSVAWE